ncbi:MAG: bifunctional nuclease family protein [Polyangiaceae bacterium]|nr:bifunctional nuclease family protein [Polyangiaceae bacterium]
MARCAALVVALVLVAPACSKLREPLRKAGIVAKAPTATPSPTPAAGPGYVRVRVGGVTRLPHGGDAVLLVEDGKRRALPIFIGGTEALSIQLRLKKQPFVRPLTHDLLDASIRKLGGKVESVRVDKIESNVFHGTLVLSSGDQRFELDARPSDAIAVAIGNDVPIHVARSVLDHAGLDLDGIEVEDGASGDRPPPVSL